MAQEVKLSQGIYGAVSDTNIFIGEEKQANKVVTWSEVNKYNTNLSNSLTSDMEADTAFLNSLIGVAQATASVAQATADTAKYTAETAVATASTAQATAETAQHTANTATYTAKTADYTAQTAQATANVAQDTAEVAQNTAEVAQLAAIVGQDLAKSAQATAATATATANVAQVAACVIQNESFQSQISANIAELSKNIQSGSVENMQYNKAAVLSMNSFDYVGRGDNTYTGDDFCNPITIDDNGTTKWLKLNGNKDNTEDYLEPDKSLVDIIDSINEIITNAKSEVEEIGLNAAQSRTLSDTSAKLYTVAKQYADDASNEAACAAYFAGCAQDTADAASLAAASAACAAYNASCDAYNASYDASCATYFAGCASKEAICAHSAANDASCSANSALAYSGNALTASASAQVAANAASSYVSYIQELWNTLNSTALAANTYDNDTTNDHVQWEFANDHISFFILDSKTSVWNRQMNINSDGIQVNGEIHGDTGNIGGFEIENYGLYSKNNADSSYTIFSLTPSGYMQCQHIMYTTKNGITYDMMTTPSTETARVVVMYHRTIDKGAWLPINMSDKMGEVLGAIATRNSEIDITSTLYGDTTRSNVLVEIIDKTVYFGNPSSADSYEIYYIIWGTKLS